MDTTVEAFPTVELLPPKRMVRKAVPRVPAERRERV